MSTSTYEERQKEELLALQSIFCGDVHDLRPKKSSRKTWCPLIVKVRLRPQQSMGHKECHAEITLRVECGSRYPDTPPQIELLNNRGVPKAAENQLLIELVEKATELLGEVMIMDLCLHVQQFLVCYNQPRAISVYDEMMQNKRKQQEEQEAVQKALEAKQKEEDEKLCDQLAEELRIRQEQFKEEARRRRADSLGRSELRLSYSSDKSPDDSEGSGGACKKHKVQQLRITINGKERTLCRGRCIGHSSKGRIAFMAMETNSGEHFCLHEWIFIQRSLDRSKDLVLNAYQQGLLDQVDQQFGILCRVQHPNIVRYFGMLQESQKDKITISILQEMLAGHAPLKMHVSKGIPLDLQVVRSYCQDILCGLLHLHENNLVHGGLALSNVFVSQQGIARMADFGVVNILDSLMRSVSCPSELDLSKAARFGKADPKMADIYAFGMLVLKLAQGMNVREDATKVPSTLPRDVQDFLRKCLAKNERERWSADQLSKHAFITQKLDYKLKQISNSPTETSDLESLETDTADEAGVSAVGDNSIPKSYNTLPSTSRLKTEFHVLEFLGSGGFGFVLKARNKLDNRIYAIKQIRLDPSNRHLNRKINREVMLLSRLNHENVVRYFNSWIEVVEMEPVDTAAPSSAKSADSLSSLLNHAEPQFEAPPMPTDTTSVEWELSLSHVMTKPADESGDSSEEELFGIGHKSESSDIMFERSSNSKTSQDSVDANSTADCGEKPLPRLQYMFIQMEFCEKQTLRNAIDEGLYHDPDRMWRLFREIIEGLVHIHQQGIIHRDLKPVNIFLDSEDRAKIGDFGLATTARGIRPEEGDLLKSPDFSVEVGSGRVGTELYTAPESGSGGTYTQKVDIYSLGVIFFEMCYPCETKMERARNLTNIRQSSIILPLDAENRMSEQQIRLLQWLLKHDPCERPTSSELLSSSDLPPPVIEEAELNEMLRRTVTNPQSKTFKKLLGSLFHTTMRPANEYTFDIDDVQNSDASLRSLSVFSFVRDRIEAIMRLHGAQNIHVPLLMPRSALFEPDENVVELMDNQGSVVSIPHNSRVPFARYVARKNIPYMKRYAIERVFRSRRILGCHPKELFEASFDIITNSIDPTERLPLFEVLSITEEIISQFAFAEKSDYAPYLRINHFGLLKALLLYTGITDQGKQYRVMKLLRSRYMSRLKIQNQLSDMNLSESCINMISQFREVEDTMPKVSAMFRSIVNNRGAAGAVAKDALDELNIIISLLESIQYRLTVMIVPCLVHDVNIYNGGLLFEVKLRTTKQVKTKQDVLAVGGHYDSLVNRFRVRLPLSDTLPPHRAVGVSFTVDRLVKLAAEFDKLSYVDAVVCTASQKSMTRETALLLRNLWLASVSGAALAPGLSVEEISQICREMNVNQILLLKDTDPEMVKVRTFDKDKYTERRVSLHDALDSVSSASRQDVQSTSQTLATVSKKDDRPATVESMIRVMILTRERLSGNQRKRIETHVVAVLKAPLARCINDKLFVEVIAVDMNLQQIRNFVVSLVVEQDERAFQTSIKELMDRTDSIAMKSYYEEICDRIRQLVFSTTTCAAFVIFGRKDDTYKIVICPSNYKL